MQKEYTLEEVKDWVDIINGDKELGDMEAFGALLEVPQFAIWLNSKPNKETVTKTLEGNESIVTTYTIDDRNEFIVHRIIDIKNGDVLYHEASLNKEPEVEPLRIYFANDLFNEATVMFNAYVVKKIREKYGDKVEVYLPQENDAINDKSAYADSQMIAKADYDKLKGSNLLIAVLDSQDFGVGVEIGIAYEMGLPILGLYSDTRQQGADNAKKVEALKEIGENQFSYTNLMAVGLIKNNGVLVDSATKMIESIGNYLDK